MKEYKFRAWDKKNKEILSWELIKKECNKLSFLSLPEYEVMQYTGLKDKNGTGKEIYEGDVIEGNLIKYSPLPTMGEIIWDEYWCSFANKNEAGNTLLKEINQIEVIGNIWEHPHLLKETK